MDCPIMRKRNAPRSDGLRSTGGLYFLPPGETLPLTITRRRSRTEAALCLICAAVWGGSENRAHSQRIFAKIAAK